MVWPLLIAGEVAEVAVPALLTVARVAGWSYGAYELGNIANKYLDATAVKSVQAAEIAKSQVEETKLQEATKQKVAETEVRKVEVKEKTQQDAIGLQKGAQGTFSPIDDITAALTAFPLLRDAGDLINKNKSVFIVGGIVTAGILITYALAGDD